MKKSITIFSCLLFCLLFACTSQKYTPADFPETQIRFGSGGGVAGIETTYSLLANGKMFLQKGTDQAFESAGKVSKKQCQALFVKSAEMGMEKMKYQKPGNVYKFIEIGQTGTFNRISWGDDGPEEVVALYKELQALIK